MPYPSSLAQAEIERLRLIVQKLHRSQFGRRAEQLDDSQLLFGSKIFMRASRSHASFRECQDS
jgi:hypothetical protein